MTGYPDNNPKTQFGLAKTPLHLAPPALAEGAAEAFANGAAKYGPFNWREKQISSTVYYAACLRHLHAWYDRVDKDDNAPDSGVHHIKHAAACLGMILDTMGTDLLNDNRPFPRARTNATQGSGSSQGISAEIAGSEQGTICSGQSQVVPQKRREGPRLPRKVADRKPRKSQTIRKSVPAPPPRSRR